MKNILKTLVAGVAGIAFSMSASAATQDSTMGPGANAIATAVVGTSAADTCALLDESVSINISKDVLGSVVCDDSANGVGVALCHPNGRKDASANGFIHNVGSLGGSITSLQTAACSTTETSTDATTVAGGGTAS